MNSFVPSLTMIESPEMSAIQPVSTSNQIAADAVWQGVTDDAFFRLTVHQYHQMIAAGILAHGDPVELLEGWLVRKMSKHPPHMVAAQLAADALLKLLPAGWCIRPEGPITLEDSEPEPDMVVVRGSIRDYAQRHPGGSDIGLVVEVSDASLSQDRRFKGRIFARAGISTYWIVNVVDRQVEVYSEPMIQTPEPRYRNRKDFGPGLKVPVLLEGKEIGHVAVDDILP